jgi:chlorobactene glucosyltransferase
MSDRLWTLALPAVLPLGLTLLNLATWPRGRTSGGTKAGKVSVLIPARNEADNIERAVQAALACQDNVHEVVVYDDQSTDGTGDRVLALAATDPRVRLVRGAPLPDGWIGKPHACHQLALAATGDVFFFIDADTALEPEGIARVLSLLEPGRGAKADAVTAVPRQDVETFAERLIVPLLILTYTSWFPLVLVSLSRDPRFLAANGQVLAVRRTAYQAIGGFESVRQELVDDMAFCRRLKVSGHRLVFADGFRIARCRMYTGPQQVWEGFSKNLYEGIGATPFALAVVVALYSACFILPYVALAIGLAQNHASLLGAGALGVACNVVLRTLLAARFAQPVSGLLLHPISILGLLAIAFNSMRWSLQNRLNWRGRTYASRRERLAS